MSETLPTAVRVEFTGEPNGHGVRVTDANTGERIEATELRLTVRANEWTKIELDVPKQVAPVEVSGVVTATSPKLFDVCAFCRKEWKP